MVSSLLYCLPSPLENKKMAPGYEMGPLGVAVMKDKYSTTGRGQRSPTKMASSAVELSDSPRGPIGLSNTDIIGSGEIKTSSLLLPPSEGGAGGVVDCDGLPSRRGSGLRELMGIETNAERDREKSRVQAEALKKQVEDNKVGLGLSESVRQAPRSCCRKALEIGRPQNLREIDLLQTQLTFGRSPCLNRNVS